MVTSSLSSLSSSMHRETPDEFQQRRATSDPGWPAGISLLVTAMSNVSISYLSPASTPSRLVFLSVGQHEIGSLCAHRFVCPFGSCVPPGIQPPRGPEVEPNPPGKSRTR